MKVWIRVVVATTTFLTVTSCTTRKDIQDDDVAVVSAVIKQLCHQSTGGFSVLSSSSAVVSPIFAPKALDASTRQSLLNRNASSAPLPEVETCPNLRRVDAQEIDRYLERPKNDRPPGYDRWSAFYGRFLNAQGVVRLSLPGYSEQGEVAVVQVSAACGETCGSGFFWVLHRVSGHWQLDFRNSVQGWVS
jgi:hypothetical protein